MTTPTRKTRKTLRVLLIAGLTTVATAAIGFGGLAAWSVTTQNTGSTIAAGTVHHSNKATSNISVTGASGPASVVASCTDATSPGSCGLLFNITNAKPGAVVTGSVQITNTGTLQSTFSLGLNGAPTGTLCGDLTLGVVDNETTPATVYATGALASLPTTAIKTAGTSPSLPNSSNWNATDTGTYTFTVTLSAAAPATDMGTSCAANFVFTQTNT